MARVKAIRIVALAATLTAAACDHLERRETVSLHAGDAAAANIAVQMIDPWPYYAGDQHIPGDGVRTAAAVERYRKNEVVEPRGMGTSALPQAGGDR